MLKNSIRRVLLVKKTSRLAYERRRASLNDERALAQKLVEQGSDYDGLLERHLNHEKNSDRILQCLRSKGILVNISDRDNLVAEDVDKADIVIAAGGDGNFLSAASKVRHSNRLVVGINTDPEKSEGHLCITPSSNYTIDQIVEDVLNERLKSIRRQRIRACLSGRSLPVLSLNEVFIGDSDPTQACYFEVSCDNGTPEKIRSSGLLVFTGTGSTSWSYNTRKLHSVQVAKLLSIACVSGAIHYDALKLKDIASRASELYNEELIFPGNDTKMGCVIREPIKRGSTGGFLSNPVKYCDRISIKSRSFDNLIIIDGQHHYRFPNGLGAEFHINPQDSLLTLSDNKSTTENR